MSVNEQGLKITLPKQFVQAITEIITYARVVNRFTTNGPYELGLVVKLLNNGATGPAPPGEHLSWDVIADLMVAALGFQAKWRQSWEDSKKAALAVAFYLDGFVTYNVKRIATIKTKEDYITVADAFGYFSTEQPLKDQNLEGFESIKKVLDDIVSEIHALSVVIEKVLREAAAQGNTRNVEQLIALVAARCKKVQDALVEYAKEPVEFIPAPLPKV